MPLDETIRAEGWAAGRLAQAQSDFNAAPSLSSQQNALFPALQTARIMHGMAREKLETEKFRERLEGKISL